MAEGQRYSGTWRFPFQAVVVKREQNELHLVVCTKTSSSNTSYHILAKLLIFDTPKRAFLIDMDLIIMCNDFAPFASKFKSLYWLELLRRVLYECFAIDTMQKTGIEAFLAVRGAFEGVCKLRPACKMLGLGIKRYKVRIIHVSRGALYEINAKISHFVIAPVRVNHDSLPRFLNLLPFARQSHNA